MNPHAVSSSLTFTSTFSLVISFCILSYGIYTFMLSLNKLTSPAQTSS